jgi:predicted nucleic acid-binding protein
VNAYPDASFLVALYLRQQNADLANAYAATMTEPIHVTSLLRFETGNAIRRQAWQRQITEGAALAALAALDSDVDAGVVVIATVDWEQVHAAAERLSNAHGLRRGYRAFDVLHVATALTLGAKVFLTFDHDQAALAKAEGLKVKP